MRASRLVSIILALQNQGKMTARQLSEQLEVSERTILRDMEELSSSGVPVYAERGKEGGWLLAEGYRTSLTGMHADELAALIVASRPDLLSDLGRQQQLEAALQKLLAAATDSARSGAEAVRRKLHIDGAGWHPNRQRHEPVTCLAAVQQAVWEERKLRIAYMRDGAEKYRVVYPLGLVAKRGVWYLVANTGEDGTRTFRVSRLLQAEAQPETFAPPLQFDLAAYWETSLQQFRERLPHYPAKLRIRAAALTRLVSERFVTVLSSIAPESSASPNAGAISPTAHSGLPLMEGDAGAEEDEAGSRDDLKHADVNEAHNAISSGQRASLSSTAYVPRAPMQAGNGSESDWLRADVAFETMESACEIVLGYGGRVEVLEPPELRERVKDEIESARMLYW